MNEKKMAWLLIFIFFVVMFILSIPAIVIHFHERFTGTTQASEEEPVMYYQPAPTSGAVLEAIELDAEITIPASAREIHAMIFGFRDIDTWVRLDLPSEELAEFLRNTQCDTPLTQVNPANFYRHELDPEWWQPDVAKSLEMCTGGHDYLYTRVLVDRTNPDMVTIYVFSATDD